MNENLVNKQLKEYIKDNIFKISVNRPLIPT